MRLSNRDVKEGFKLGVLCKRKTDDVKIFSLYDTVDDALKHQEQHTTSVSGRMCLSEVRYRWNEAEASGHAYCVTGYDTACSFAFVPIVLGSRVAVLLTNGFMHTR